MTAELAHADHLVVDAMPEECALEECEHPTDGSGKFDCSIEFDTCLDCMAEAGYGRDPSKWDDVPLQAWPHPGSAGWTG